MTQAVDIGCGSGAGDISVYSVSVVPGATVTLSGPLAEITAYMTGRAHKLTTADGEPAPVLGPWL